MEPDPSAPENSAARDGDNDGAAAAAAADVNRPPMLSYATPGSPKLKTIRQLSSFEANLAAAKLDAAGVTCFVIDDNIATAYPLGFASTKLQVPEDEVEQAEAVLAAPAVLPADPEDEERGEDEATAAAAAAAAADDDDESESDYVVESFRCPRCHRKDVELMPLSATMGNVRFGCLMILLLPVIVSIAAWMFSSGSRGVSPDLLSPEAMLAWVVVLAVLCFIVLTAKRRKHCRACQHEWVG
jgi:hypothetical protein